MRRFILDTDAASDDVVALIMALRDESCKLEAITVVGGALPLPVGIVNARAAIEVADTYQPPVYAGMSKPLWRPAKTGEPAHGQDGLSDVGLSKTNLPLAQGHAVDAILRLAREYDDLEIITIGPMTNIAMAIMLDMQTMKRVKGITAMGGQYRMMNDCTANAEFNIWVDAEAADIVLQSGIPTTFVPLDACYGKAEITREDRETLLGLGTYCGEFIVKANQKLLQYNIDFYDKDIISQPDPSAVACLLAPGVQLATRTAKARVETKSALGYGQILYDFDTDEPHNVTLVTEIDGPAFKRYMFEIAGKK
ncbi:nucleoside hydrolase [Ruminococcaceae bacterium OttesenSCG-928-N02]|nr:nucleoside hydrolase [Ruminococcaceae bacterium OttesenSCG-928-N02]